MIRTLCWQYGALMSMLALGGCGESLVQLTEPDLDMSTSLLDMTGLQVDEAAPQPDFAMSTNLDFQVPPLDLNGLDLHGVDLQVPSPDMIAVDALRSLDLSFDMLVPDLPLPAPDLLLADLKVPSLDLVSLTPDLALLRDASSTDQGGDFGLGNSDSRCPSVLFDGKMALLTAPAIAAYNPTLDVTVEAWVYPEATGTEMIIAGHTGDPALMTASYYLGIDAGGHAFFNTSTTGANANLATSTSIVPLNQWTQVAGEFDSANTRVIVYVGGQPGGQLTPVVLGPRSVSNVPLHVGRYSTVTPVISPFHGYIDEVRFSSSARYVAAYTPARSFVSDASTLALYHFNENTGQTAADASTNANVGALQLNAQFADAPVCQ